MRPSARADIGAAAEAARYQARPFELIKSASDSASCRVEGDGKLTFRRQPVSFAIGAGFDGAPQISGNRADALAALLRMRRKLVIDSSGTVLGQCLHLFRLSLGNISLNCHRH